MAPIRRATMIMVYQPAIAAAISAKVLTVVPPGTLGRPPDDPPDGALEPPDATGAAVGPHSTAVYAVRRLLAARYSTNPASKAAAMKDDWFMAQGLRKPDLLTDGGEEPRSDVTGDQGDQDQQIVMTLH